MDAQRKARNKDWIYYGGLFAVSILAFSTVLDLLRLDKKLNSLFGEMRCGWRIDCIAIE